LLDEDDYIDNLGYIVERRYSAIAWSSFFEFVGKDVVLDDNSFANACVAKISEAEERLSYIDFLIGSVFDRSELNEARFFYESGDFAFCIFKASKVKADANAIILSMSLSRDKLVSLLMISLLLLGCRLISRVRIFLFLGIVIIIMLLLLKILGLS
jgi:predicted S18 family serine protease